MTLGIADAIRSTRADEIRDAVDADASAGILIVYDGVRPSKGGTTTTALATFTLPDPVAPNAVAGVSTWNAISASTISVTATASWFRVTDGAAAFVFDGDCGLSGSDLNFDSLSFVSGRSVTIDSFIISDGNA